MASHSNPGLRRRARSFGISLILHGLVVGWVCWQAVPQFIQPSSVRWGEGGSSVAPLYFAKRGAEDLIPADQVGSKHRSPVQYPARRRSSRADSAIQQAVKNENSGKSSKESAEGPRAGSPYGSLAEGPATGEEVKPALPVYGPQPQVASYEIPAGLEGDIVVEITIDAQGKVTQTSLLRGLGHGLDERVLAVLPSWRFHPATRDGVPIASRQDVYFHFPWPA